MPLAVPALGGGRVDRLCAIRKSLNQKSGLSVNPAATEMTRDPLPARSGCLVNLSWLGFSASIVISSPPSGAGSGGFHRGRCLQAASRRGRDIGQLESGAAKQGAGEERPEDR